MLLVRLSWLRAAHRVHVWTGRAARGGGARPAGPRRGTASSQLEHVESEVHARILSFDPLSYPAGRIRQARARSSGARARPRAQNVHTEAGARSCRGMGRDRAPAGETFACMDAFVSPGSPASETFACTDAIVSPGDRTHLSETLACMDTIVSPGGLPAETLACMDAFVSPEGRSPSARDVWKVPRCRHLAAGSAGFGVDMRLSGGWDGGRPYSSYAGSLANRSSPTRTTGSSSARRGQGANCSGRPAR